MGLLAHRMALITVGGLGELTGLSGDRLELFFSCSITRIIKMLVQKRWGDMVPRDNPPRDNVPRDNVPQDNPPRRQCAPETICPETICPGDYPPRRQPAPETTCPGRQHAPETIRPGGNMPQDILPWRLHDSGDNVPRQTTGPGRQCAPETMCPRRQCAPEDNVSRETMCYIANCDKNFDF